MVSVVILITQFIKFTKHQMSVCRNLNKFGHRNVVSIRKSLFEGKRIIGVKQIICLRAPGVTFIK